VVLQCGPANVSSTVVMIDQAHIATVCKVTYCVHLSGIWETGNREGCTWLPRQTHLPGIAPKPSIFLTTLSTKTRALRCGPMPPRYASCPGYWQCTEDGSSVYHRTTAFCTTVRRDGAYCKNPKFNSRYHPVVVVCRPTLKRHGVRD
jgi:hypothetical protein